MVKFLQELCGLARHLQPVTRNELLAQLVSLGLFEVVTFEQDNKTFEHFWIVFHIFGQLPGVVQQGEVPGQMEGYGHVLAFTPAHARVCMLLVKLF